MTVDTELKMKTDNELIAEFMGLEKKEGNWGGYGSFTKDGELFHTMWPISYDESWDDLRPVIEKIAKWEVYYEASSLHSIRAKQVLNLPISTDIRLVHFDIVEFIKWFNKHKS